MPSFVASEVERFRSAASLVAGLPSEVADFRALSEPELLAVNDEISVIIRSAQARQAAIAGEIARRSRHELGGQGLVQRAGHRTVEGFLKHTAGLTGQQAVTAVRAGTLLTEIADDGRVDSVTGEVLAPSQPWLAPVAAALLTGDVSPSAAEVIGLGLGAPNSAVSADDLRSAAARLVAESRAGVHPDRLRVRARELRDELDVAGVKLREEERRAARGLVHFRKAAGGWRTIIDHDDEDGAAFAEIIDRATSPKLRGVRFGSAAQRARAERIERDPRTIRQLAFDAFMQLIRQGADYDTSFMLGTGAPVIRITVAEQALETGIGVGRIDGQPDPVSLDTVQRLLCTADTIRIGIDPTGNILDLEKEHRLFSRRQREALATKFGGCMDPTCDRPPSWCEAHHIRHWKRDGGKTEIHNGILLCKHHHLKYHNEGWEILRDDTGAYWLVPPPGIDPEKTPRLMPLKSRNLDDLQRANNPQRAAS
jgi:hypothetical protein